MSRSRWLLAFLPVVAVAGSGCGNLLGGPTCPGSSANLVYGPSDDPKWTQPGQPAGETLSCIHGGVQTLYFDLPDGRPFKIDLQCAGDCAPGAHRCRETADPLPNDVYVTIKMLDSDPDRIKFINSQWQAGGSGSGSAYEGTSCSYTTVREGKKLTGTFTGTLGAKRTSDMTLKYERVNFDFTLDLP